MTGAGDALDRDVINEAAGHRADGADARLVRGGGQEIDQVDPRLAQAGHQLPALLRRGIDHQDAIHPGGAGLLGEGGIAQDLDGIEIAHEDDGGRRVPLPELSHHLQDIAQPGMVGQGALAGALDHGAVGHGIGEGHAQLDEVGTGGDHGVHQGHGGGQVRVPRGDEGDEGGAAAGGQVGETSGDAAHRVRPSRAATVCMSLSPRPDRLIRMA